MEREICLIIVSEDHVTILRVRHLVVHTEANFDVLAYMEVGIFILFSTYKLLLNMKRQRHNKSEVWIFIFNIKDLLQIDS